MGRRGFDLPPLEVMDIGSISTLTQQLSCSYQCFFVIAGPSFKGQGTNSFPLTFGVQLVSDTEGSALINTDSVVSIRKSERVL